MTDRPIPFSPPMVRAILDGRKTQTRRILKAKRGVTLEDYTADAGPGPNGVGRRLELPPEKLDVRYAVGDRLWVREPWRVGRRWDGTAPRDLPYDRGLTTMYAAGGSYARASVGGPYVPDLSYPPEGQLPDWAGKLRPAMFLMRVASRLTLILAEVRVERLQDISRQDAIAEGVEYETADPPFYYVPDIWPYSLTAVGIEEPGSLPRAVRSFAKLWDFVHGPGAWDRNPWVVVNDFAGGVLPHNIDSSEASAP